MIFFNENLKLNEAVDLANPTISSEFFNIYEIEDLNDFNEFTLNGAANVANHYNFSQSNWNNNVANGAAKPFIITNKNSNECLAMFLLFHNNLKQFYIRTSKNIDLPIAFESNTSDSISDAYNLFVNNNSPLPLYTILDKYRNFTGYNPDTNITDDGQYIKNNKLYGIFKDFFRLDSDGNFIKPINIDLNKLNLTTLLPGSINYKDMDPDEDFFNHIFYITFYDNLTQIDNNAINLRGFDDGFYMDYDGDEEELPEVFNTLPEDVRNSIDYNDSEDSEQRRAQRAAEREAEAQAERERIAREQEEADRQVAQTFDNQVLDLFDKIVADDYVFDDNDENTINYFEQIYNDHLTDNQKRLIETNGNLEIAKREYYKKRDQYYADKFINNINNILNEINAEDYIYNPKIDTTLNGVIGEYENNLSDDVKQIINNEFNFSELVNEIKQKQATAKQAYEENKIRRLANSNTILYDNFLIVKFVGNEAYIIGHKKSLSNEQRDLMIPSKINDKKVTRIEKYAFESANINKLYLPRYLKYIGEYAFYNAHVNYWYIVDKSSKYLSRIKCAATIFGDKIDSHYTNDRVSLQTYSGSGKIYLRSYQD